jgi:hypothetical protein
MRGWPIFAAASSRAVTARSDIILMRFRIAEETVPLIPVIAATATSWKFRVI